MLKMRWWRRNYSAVVLSVNTKGQSEQMNGCELEGQGNGKIKYSKRHYLHPGVCAAKY